MVLEFWSTVVLEYCSSGGL
jgi:hypothetical protein